MAHRGSMGIRVARLFFVCTFFVSALSRADDAAVVEDASFSTLVMTAEDSAIVGVGTATVPGGYVNTKDPWIDRAHQGVFNAVWRSAMRMDSWFGGHRDQAAYMESTGS